MDAFVNFNGKFFKAGAPLVKANNRAFCYGDALFETMRWHDTEILFLKDHVSRLLRGMKFLKMEIPGYFSVSFFQKQIADICKKNKITADARIRLQVYRMDGGYYTPSNNLTGFVINAEKIESSFCILNTHGLTVNLFSEMKKLRHPVSNLKTSNSIIYVLAGIFAKENNSDDCFILNTEGQVADAVSSNVFIVRSNILMTPPLSDGCVDGVMRKNILKLCKKEKINCMEKSIRVRDLLTADEIFLTNVIKGIRWVRKFRNKTYSNKFAAMLLKKITMCF